MSEAGTPGVRLGGEWGAACDRVHGPPPRGLADLGFEAASEDALDTEAPLLAATLEALCVPAFVCTPTGELLASSAQAVQLVTDSRLRLRGGRLWLMDPLEQHALLAALSAAAGPTAARRLLLVRTGDAGRFLLEVLRAPSIEADEPKALVIVHLPRRDPIRLAAVARALFGLTPAEAAVAADLVRGRTPRRIAEHAGLSIETVRCHIRRIYDKAEVGSVVELLSLIPA